MNSIQKVYCLGLISVAGALLWTPLSHASPGTTCTVTGTPRSDVLRGTPGVDRICGLGGNDIIYGLGGNDVLLGGDGNDRLIGGAGSDSIDGGKGNDSLVGEAGLDILEGSIGNDVLEGGADNDRLSGSDGNDRMLAGSGNDIAQGDKGDDRIDGGPGDDVLQGGPGLDRITTGVGSDTCALDAADSITGRCDVDSSAPIVKWLSVPESVQAGTLFVATVSVKDKSLTTGEPDSRIGGPPGWITEWCGWPISMTLISGNKQDGVWSVSCQIPQQAVNESYSLFLNAYDDFGNRTWSEAPAFSVVGGSSDNQPPAISEVGFPTIARPGNTVTLTWRAVDSSGIKDTPYAWVYRPAPQFGVIWGDGVEAPKLTSGTIYNGTWSQKVAIPEDAISGTYGVWIGARDELGNKTYEPYGSFLVE